MDCRYVLCENDNYNYQIQYQFIMKHNYLTPEMEIIVISTETVLCGSTQTAAFSNEGYSAEESTFSW